MNRVYTAVTKGYDKKPLDFEPEEGVEREVRMAPPEIDAGPTGAKWNREQKLMFPPKTGLWSVYCDGSISPKAGLRTNVERWLLYSDMALFKHPHRTCAYAEIDACVSRNKITAEEGAKARSTLQLNGFPRDFGLWALGIVVRRVHANQLQTFAMPMTWAMTQHITRDQIWFPFAMWKLNHSMKRLHTIEGNIFDNAYFSFRRHRS